MWYDALSLFKASGPSVVKLQLAANGCIHCMKQLQCAGCVERMFLLAANHLASGQAEHGPDSLPASQSGIPVAGRAVVDVGLPLTIGLVDKDSRRCMGPKLASGPVNRF